MTWLPGLLPQDYVFTAMQVPTTRRGHHAAPNRTSLRPGTAWQYSNTTTCGRHAERVAGMPFMDSSSDLQPARHEVGRGLRRGSVQQTDAGSLRNGIGPLRAAPMKAPAFVAGQLAMTAHDLATGDLA
jgi:hypothetical protein